MNISRTQRNGDSTRAARLERASPTAADVDAAVTVMAETRMDGVGYSIARAEPPFCRTGLSGPLTLCYLVKKGTVWLELEGGSKRVVELRPGTVVGTSGLLAHWIKSSPTEPARHARPLGHEPLGPRRKADHSIEMLIGHAPLESLAVIGNPGVVIIEPDENSALFRRIWWAAAQIEEELTDSHPMGGVTAAVRRLSELILLNIVRHIVAMSVRDESSAFGTRLDIRIMRATAAAAHGPLADWDLGKLARVAGMSRTTFCERFCALTGKSPMQAITQMRLRLAASELAHGHRLVDQVAERAGYASSAAFTRAFTRYFGVPPARWRAARGA